MQMSANKAEMFMAIHVHFVLAISALPVSTMRV